MAVLSRLLFTRQGRKTLRFSPVYRNDEKSTLSTITEEGLVEEDDSDDEVESYEDWMAPCIDLLSSRDIVNNDLGLRQLLERTKDRRLTEQASLTFLYGNGPDEIRLRQVFVRFLTNEEDASCNSVSNDDDDDDYWSDSEEEEDAFPRGIESGMYHGVALQILSSSLASVAQSDDSEYNTIDFSDPFWKSIVDTLINNVETNYTNEITASSLLCLRLLHTLEPVIVASFLNQVLLPYLFHLRDHSNDLPRIQSEASRLIARAHNHFKNRLIWTAECSSKVKSGGMTESKQQQQLISDSS
eukprot:scaffold23891_cov132-Cylindrotheca_fusiformis.AAC.6